MGSSLSSTKEKIAVVTLTYVLQDLLGVLSLHRFIIFGILDLACLVPHPTPTLPPVHGNSYQLF